MSATVGNHREPRPKNGLRELHVARALRCDVLVPCRACGGVRGLTAATSSRCKKRSATQRSARNRSVDGRTPSPLIRRPTRESQQAVPQRSDTSAIMALSPCIASRAFGLSRGVTPTRPPSAVSSTRPASARHSSCFGNRSAPERSVATDEIAASGGAVADVLVVVAGVYIGIGEEEWYPGSSLRSTS